MSAAADAAPAELTPAERVRSLLAQAVSLSLTTEGQDYDLIGMHSVGPKGRICLHPPADSPLSAQVAMAPHGNLATLLEFTDVAATAVRDRIRAKVTISGWLTPAGGGHDEGRLRLDTARVTLRTTAGSLDVGLDEVALAEPDPLAVDEAAMLTHLADAHGDMVAELVIRAGSQLPPGILRTAPLALDRHGITLRCEYRRGHCDLRFPFPATARDTAEAGEQVRQLLTAPRRCANLQHSPWSRSTRV
ncbi:DUF2470 domain-containing protein [Streptomyces sp. ERV7]|uniref:DUF2470 domain-containing protein n=1 Tax=Streptomyces sp. ERV7 TaxID=1322334 RepID=UPI0007F32D5D|nr:DUF2470 domain-containing protein [Streptomyces sp. ERV7]OAR26960.1 DUF2470 domain-containing protein [Streptomyces sp. ERV7]